MLKTIGQYYRTIKHLEPIQIRYRIWYSLRDKLRKFTGHSYPLSITKRGHALQLNQCLPKPVCVSLGSEIKFSFLNQSKSFDNKIGWNFNAYGKLWSYNLNYFDYLSQETLDKEEGLVLIRDFIEQSHVNREGMEPYPIALRGINWIKFLSKHDISDDVINASLYAQYRILFSNIEYHILANHLLENGCSLLWAAYYFRDEEFLGKSQEILSAQLEEQILNDGAHYERSPMYHRILLEKLLDCINLLENNSSWKRVSKLQSHMQSKLEMMMGWLLQVSLNNGDIPHFNDSTDGVAPGKKDLVNYADTFGIKANDLPLDGSGYRKLQKGDFELVVDAGKIGPDYQPAHGHCDTLSFVLYFQNAPIFIDTAISTYETNNQRLIERSTAAHNTVRYGNYEQSEIWKAFRVGRRAKPILIDEGENFIRASHDGYQHLKVAHVREWIISDSGIRIIDNLDGKVQEKSTAYFHIYPNIEPVKKTEQIFQIGNLTLSLTGVISAEIKKWRYPQGYNCYSEGYKLEVTFDQELESRITH